MGYTAALVDRSLIKGVQSGTSEGVDVAGCSNLAFYVVGLGAPSAGAVIIEESHDKDYTGTWTPIGAAVTVILGVAAPVKVNATAKAVRARISPSVIGGTVSVFLVGR
jgi:hypothetical protein